MSASAAFAGVRLHHFGVSVADPEETAKWHREKLGFEPLYRFEIPGTGARVAFLGLGGFRVEIFEVEGHSPTPSSQQDPSVGVLKHATRGPSITRTKTPAKKSYFYSRKPD